MGKEHETYKDGKDHGRCCAKKPTGSKESDGKDTVRGRRAAQVSMSWVWRFVVDNRVVDLAPAVALARGLTLRKVLLRDAVELTGDVGPPPR